MFIEAIPQTLRWRESCVVAACRVSAVIWLKCVRNVIWAHLIYFIHWQPIWPGLSAILQFQLAHNLGAAAEPQPLIGQVSPSLASDWLVRPLTGHNIGLSLHAWRGSSVQLCMTRPQARQHQPGENTRDSRPLHSKWWASHEEDCPRTWTLNANRDFMRYIEGNVTF